MSEPTTRATQIVRLTSEILHWSIRDERIKNRSDAYAIRDEERTVLIDPLPLEESLYESLGKVQAICLTGSCHQRSTWSLRQRFGAKVYAPRGASGLEQSPDVWYGSNDRLPGGLKPVHSPGPTEAYYVFLFPQGRGALFCADLLVHDGGKVTLLPDKYMDDPVRLRESIRKLMDLRFGLLCFSHGPPLIAAPHEVIPGALEVDAAGAN